MDGDPVELAAMPVIIVQCEVKRAAVIPDADIVLRPAASAGELGLARMRPQEFQQRPAFLQGHIGEAGDETAIHVEALASGFGMRSHNRVVGCFSEPGSTILTASTGYEALRILVERSVDLLLTDLEMPGISGFELARQAKLMRPNLHVIYISGRVSGSVRNGLVYGMLLPKPIRTGVLLEAIDREMSGPPGAPRICFH
jgi:CheY-like chemotaxis protein